jgi:tetratricopeptide (TPR) repeat protein
MDHFYRALAFQCGKEYVKAIEDYDEYLVNNPWDVEALVNRGCAKDEVGDVNGALADMAMAIQINPKYSKAYHNRACVLHQRRGEYKLAISDYSRSIALGFMHPYSFSGRASCYVNLGNLNEALRDYSKAIDLDPDNPDRRIHRARIFREKKLYEQALKDLNQAIKMCPDCGEAYYNRACLNSDCGLYDLAIQDFTKALALKYVNANVFSGRAQCYKHLNLLDDALGDYFKAMEIEPKEPAWPIHRSYVYLKKNMCKDAVNHCHNAMEIVYPEYNPQQLVYLVCRENLKKGEEATKKLSDAGFYICFEGDLQKKMIIFPSPKKRIVLNLNKLNIEDKRLRQELNKNWDRYDLIFNADFDAIMEAIEAQFNKKDESYWQISRYFFTAMNQSAISPRAVSFALYNKDNGELAAGDMGILTGKVYSSYTCCRKESGAGNVLLIKVCKWLREEMGILYMDLGPSTWRWDPYKLKIGAEVMGAEAWLSLFNKINPGSDKVYKKRNKPRKR